MIFKHILFLTVVIFVGFIPMQVSRAAQLSFEIVSPEEVGDTATIIEIFLDTEGVPVNAVEGMVGFLGDGAEQISEVVVETGGSVFEYWLVYPEYSASEGVIRFTGGTPEAFSLKEPLFRMRVFAKKQEELTLSWLGGSAYRSDGDGTEESISGRSLTLMVAKGEPNQMSASSVDTTPPHFDEVKISQDADLYEGKYFLSFHAVDDISGVVGYEVVEGRETTRADNGTYLLKDQERNTKIVIIAYDGAGNSVSVKAPTKYDWLSWVAFGGVVIFLILAVLYWYTYRRCKKLLES